jgi:16S rRNA (adenine1518-N6/adenine1519-N6)-dimethyltransferase
MTSPSRLLKALNIPPKKQLGQNFLSDPSTAEMIATRSGISADDIVLEIGAGLGALTVPVARLARKVYAVETDRRIIPLLKNELLTHNIGNVDLLEKNILDVDITTLGEKEGGNIVVIGNLPYNISSQVLVQLINSRSVIDRAVLMFQKELARRLAANPGGRDYGRLSVMLGYCAEIDTLAEIKAHLFFPKPKVDSQVLKIKFKKILEYPATDETFFFKVIKAAFSKRRKTLKNALAGSELHIDAEIALKVLDAADIDPARRAETLTLSEFVRLSNSFENITAAG